MANLSIQWPKNKAFSDLVQKITFEWESYFKRVGERVSSLPSFTVASLPSAADNPRMLIYVSDAAGGAIPAFSDAVNWRRVDTRAIVT